MTSNTLELGPTSLRVVQVVALLLIVLKVAQLSFAGVFMDESYYWMWGQHPSLSYYDHPPLNAWLLGLSSSVFGWNVFALRLPVAMTFMADVGAIYLMSRQLAGQAWRSHFWPTLLLFLVTPIYWLMSGLALPDHVLLTGCLFAFYFFHRLFADRAAGNRGRDRDLYLGALTLGLAGLAKYNAAFLGIGLVVYVVLFHRAMLGEARLYLAAALTLLLQAPVAIWNVQEGFASFEFILHGRHAGLPTPYSGLLALGLSLAVFVSPFLLWPIGKFVVGRNAVPGDGLARTVFVISTLSILAASMTTIVLFHWNLVAYAAMLPFLAFVMRPRVLLPLQALLGIAFAVAAFINYAVTPLTDIEGLDDEATAWSYGWTPTAEAVKRLQLEYKTGFIATADYTTASLLGFALQDRDVTSLSWRRDAYDFWFNARAHTGEDAILFGDRWRGLPDGVKHQFETVTELDMLTVERGGQMLDQHRIYLGKGFRPDG